MIFLSRGIYFFDKFLEKFSFWGIIIGLCAIILLSMMGIILRPLGITFLWIEPLCRHLVLLLIFLGGSLATGKDQHIKINLLGSKLMDISKNFILLFSSFVAFLLVVSSWKFFMMEKEFGAKSFFGLHSSSLVLIIPFGFGLIFLRFFNVLIIEMLKRKK